jgi:hypothetical protein
MVEAKDLLAWGLVTCCHDEEWCWRSKMKIVGVVRV